MFKFPTKKALLHETFRMAVGCIILWVVLTLVLLIICGLPIGLTLNLSLKEIFTSTLLATSSSIVILYYVLLWRLLFSHRAWRKIALREHRMEDAFPGMYIVSDDTVGMNAFYCSPIHEDLKSLYTELYLRPTSLDYT